MSDINYERHKKGKYLDPSPYPAVKVLRTNLNYAEILKVKGACKAPLFYIPNILS